MTVEMVALSFFQRKAILAPIHGLTALHLNNGKTTLATIPGKGLSVISTTRFATGAIIEDNIYMRFDYQERDHIWATRLRRYVYSWLDGTNDKTVVLAIGNLNFCNHSSNANSVFNVFSNPEIIRLKAIKDIRQGEEITINYDYDIDFIEL
jgi:hypothetical protein